MNPEVEFKIIIAFPCLSLAVAWRARLWALQRAFGLDMCDLALASRDARGRFRVRRTPSPCLAGALGGAFWGCAIGMFLGGPMLGASCGALAGAAYGRRVHFGLDDLALGALASELAPGEAAVAVLARRIDLDATLDAWASLRGSGRILCAALPAAEAAALRRAIGGL